MPYHQGRLIDHIGIHVSDLNRRQTFCLAVLNALGKPYEFGGDDKVFYFDEFYVGADGQTTSHIHLTFRADSIEAVHAFHSAGITAGGTDNGQPGYREYHKTYFAAFLLDPDGNNIEAVCDVGSIRSSASVVISRNEDSP